MKRRHMKYEEAGIEVKGIMNGTETGENNNKTGIWLDGGSQWAGIDQALAGICQ